MDMVINLLKAEKSYDTLPNFTASDIKRLIGVGRNEYIEIINKARSKKWLWRINKNNILKDLLPKRTLKKFRIDYWWKVENVDIPQNDFLRFHHDKLTEDEKLAIGLIKSKGEVQVSAIKTTVLISLYQKSLIFFKVPVQQTDFIVVPTLKNFIMNRKPTDIFEKIVYDILVTIDERTSIAEISSILEVDVETVKDAVSLCCRCGFSLKRIKQPKKELLNNVSSEDDNNTNDGVEIIDDWKDSVLEYHKILKTTATTKSLTHLNMKKIKKQKRVGFIFDNSLTAHLMFGNLGPEVKSHAVTLFEIGKLTDESLDDFIVHLDKVQTPDKTIGEAKVYYKFAISLRQTLKFLRRNEDFSFETFDGGVDMLRCESLAHLDSQTKLKILKTNYSIIVTQAPLKPKSPLPMCMSQFFGPSLMIMNSPWFKFFMYERVKLGPTSILFKKGYRANLLPKEFLNNERCLFSTWDLDSNVLKSNYILQTLNDSLLHSPCCIQILEDNFNNSKNDMFFMCFPYQPDDYKHENEDEGKQIEEIMKRLTENMYLQYSFGFVNLLRIRKSEKETKILPLDLTFGILLDDDDLNTIQLDTIKKLGLFKKESIKKHDSNMKKLTNEFIKFLDDKLSYTSRIENSLVYPTKCIYFSKDQVEDYDI